MGFKSSVDLLAPLPIQACFELLRQVGEGVKKYKLMDESPHTYSLTWRKGFGWSNPIRIRADLRPVSPTQTLVILTADVAALADPFNFSTRALDAFERPLKAHLAKLVPTVPGGSETVAPTVSVADELKKLAELQSAGALSNDEFQILKRKLLER